MDTVAEPEAMGEAVASGIQPSGSLHLGNYFGAMRQHLHLQEDYEAYYFIVNYHALTTVQDRDTLKEATFNVALDYLALGLDPEKANLFLQSDIPQVTELAWIFSNLISVAELERGVAYKDKVAQGLSPTAGLFTYPVLMAADILIYGGSLVPVGADQQQHLEVTRDLARRFNRLYCPDAPFFPIPEAYILNTVAIIPGTDGRKMSKSYGNTLPIFDEGPELKKKVMSIVTDSTPLEAPKDPERDNVFALIKLFAGEEDQARIAAAYRAGGYGYGEAKRELFGMIEAYFAEAREKRRALAKEPDYVYDVLREGGQKARERAEAMMERVRDRVGLLTTRRRSRL